MIQIEGLRDFQRDLKRFEPVVAKSLMSELRTIVRAVAGEAALHAPRRTGKLARGIKASVTQRDVSVVSTVPYAWIIERGGRHPVFGHSDRWVFQPARPHVFPAVERRKSDVEKAALDALDNAIRQVGF